MKIMSIKSIKLWVSGLTAWLCMSVVTVVFANVTAPGSTALIPNPLATGTLFGFVTLLLDTIFPIASLVSVFLLIYAGFLMVVSGGSEEKLSKAKTAFLWTVIGIGILLGAKVLSAVVCGTVQQLGTFSLSCPTP